MKKYDYYPPIHSLGRKYYFYEDYLKALGKRVEKVSHEICNVEQDCELMDLPNEILFEIILFVDLPDLLKFRFTCRRIYQLIYSEQHISHWNSFGPKDIVKWVEQFRVENNMDSRCLEDFITIRYANSSLGSYFQWRHKKVKHRITGKFYKVIEIPFTPKFHKTHTVIKGLVSMIKNPHPNICRVYDIFIEIGTDKFEDYTIFVLCEYMNVQNFDDIWRYTKTLNCTKFSEDDLAKVLYQLLPAMEHFHRKSRIVFMNISGRSIFVNDLGMCKFSLFNPHDINQYHLTFIFPELSGDVLEGLPNNGTSDIWALGIFCLRFLNVDIELINHEQRNFWEMHKFMKEYFGTIGQKLSKSYNFSPIFVDFISKVLTFDHTKRPWCRELMDHEFVKNVFDRHKRSFRHQLHKKYIKARKEDVRRRRRARDEKKRN